MANSYLAYAALLPLANDEQGRWLKTVIDLVGDPAPPHYSGEDPVTSEARAASAVCSLDSDYGLVDLPDVEFVPRGAVLRARNGDLDVLGTLIQQFLRHFEIEAWGCEYAQYSDKLRVGSFGGGALLVTREYIEIARSPASAWLAERGVTIAYVMGS